MRSSRFLIQIIKKRQQAILLTRPEHRTQEIGEEENQLGEMYSVVVIVLEVWGGGECCVMVTSDDRWR